MTVLQESTVVNRPIDEAFAYVSDFTTTAEWDTTAKEAVKITPGPIDVGTQFKVVCALPVGSVTITYTVAELVKNSLFVLKGESNFFTMEDRITFTETDTGTKIDYRAEFFFNPLMKPLSKAAQSGLN